MRKRIKAVNLKYHLTPNELTQAKRNAKGKRITWWSDCGLVYGTINSMIGQETIYRKGQYQGLD